MSYQSKKAARERSKTTLGSLPLVERVAQAIWNAKPSEHNDADSYRWDELSDNMDRELKEEIRGMARAAIAEILTEFPTSWLDPMLTGPVAVIGEPPWGCPDIERLFAAIKGQMQEAGNNPAEHSPKHD